MRKLIIAIVVIVVLAIGFWWIRSNLQVRLSALEGEISTARRGDLVVPITASGKIEPASVTKIKGEASGEVVETPFEEGAMARKGELIVRLDESDEQRNVDRAEADWQRAKIALERAKISKREREEVGVPLAQAKLDQTEARCALAQYDFGKTDELRKKDLAGTGHAAATQLEWDSAKSRLDEAKAVVKAAKAELMQTGIAIELAGEEVKTAEEAVKTATKTLEDVKERLRETKVVSPIDGMVLKRYVQVGEMVQSGTTSLTGGTLLMEIADVGNVYAVVNVDEADIGQVHKLAPPSARPGPSATPPAAGRPATKPTTQMVEFPEEILKKEELVELTVESFPDEKFQGVIERISPQSEIVQAIATFKVRIRITSDNRAKLVGLLNTQAEARFTVRSLTNVVLVDYDAVYKDPNGEGFGVYVPVKKPGQGREEEEFLKCKFGPDNGEVVAVLEGLKESDRVYTKRPRKTEKEEKAEEERQQKEEKE